MGFFSLKNFFKAFFFIAGLGALTYYVVWKIQYRQNIMPFEEYNPTSTLVVPEHPIKKAKIPFCGYPQPPIRYAGQRPHYPNGRDG